MYNQCKDEAKAASCQHHCSKRPHPQQIHDLVLKNTQIRLKLHILLHEHNVVVWYTQRIIVSPYDLTLATKYMHLIKGYNCSIRGLHP